MRWEDTAISNISTDAIFRTVGKKFAAAFAGIGLVKVDFPGQINWATVTRAATAHTVRGYEIWRFNDALQATAPIFIRVGYGAGYANNYFGIFLQIGTGHDGAGNLTGIVSAAGWTSSWTINESYTPIWFSGDSGRIIISMWNTLASNCCSFAVVERTPGPSGAPIAAGATLITCGSGDTVIKVSSTLRFGSNPGVDTETDSNVRIATNMPTGTSGMSDNEVSIYPVRVWMARRETPPLHSLVFYFGADIAARTPFQARGWDGALRSYHPLGSAPAPGVQGLASTGMIALRWD